MPFRTAVIASALLALAVAAVPVAQAQQTVGLRAPGQGLFADLPELTVLGSLEPNVRKATAIVNGDIITDTDVDQRLALVLAASEGRVSEQERDILRVQVLRNLIDEKLQIQAASENEVSVPEAEVEQAYARVAANFRQSPEEFARFLRQAGSSPASIKQQIRAELAWSRLLRKRIEPFVNVGEEEVAAIIRKLEESKGKDEYRVGEIFLSATPDQLPRVLADAARMVQAIRSGASFVAYARQFSEASTAAVGGDLGWVRAEQLSPQLAEVIVKMPRGTVSDPVVVPGGVAIVALIDQRQVLAANPADAILSMKQITVALPEGTTEAKARQIAEQIQARTRTMGGCGRAEAVAAELGGTVVANDSIRLGDLPGPLQDIVARLPVGGATPAFGSQRDGLRVLVLCGRDDPPANAGMPSFDAIYAQITDERVNSAARRYLRDLRRDAVVDYR
ncbi:MAG: peptidylprolyl isomerase [Thermaurantiacus tibetensis]|uniref:peptidylprolyl isomerase n=1 Tax=Thermaurantiacus tibetensis TaxID=2759035 RepID=UPI00188E7BFE